MATESQIQRAFLSGVRDIVDASRYGPLRDAIARGDYEGALRAVDIDDAAFDTMRALILETYAQGGVDQMTGIRWPVNVRWNSATPQAEAYARDVVGQHITLISEDSRAALRWTMGDGIALGRSNSRIALDIVGRVGASGAREGGIVGLNARQAEWVANARRYLETGDYAAWDRLGLADKRFRFSADNPPTPAQIDRAVQLYSNRQLRSRGLTIARTERGLALNMGAMEGARQGADKAGIPVGALRKKWVHAGVHKHERYTHIALGQSPSRPFLDPFTTNGYSCQMPHDPSLPASEVINCQCRVKVSVPRNWRSLGG